MANRRRPAPRRVDMSTRRTALYRLYDRSNRLLYIGIAYRPHSRWNQHESKQPWWPRVTRYEVEWFPSRVAAERAELAAIRAERPRHNVVGNTANPSRSRPASRPVNGARRSAPSRDGVWVQARAKAVQWGLRKVNERFADR